MQYECKKIALEVEVDIDRARTFLEIVHTGSFLKAAERLHVTQTTVSARVRMLEEELGRRLFIRNRNGATVSNPRSTNITRGDDGTLNPPGNLSPDGLSTTFSLRM